MDEDISGSEMRGRAIMSAGGRLGGGVKDIHVVHDPLLALTQISSHAPNAMRRIISRPVDLCCGLLNANTSFLSIRQGECVSFTDNARVEFAYAVLHKIQLRLGRINGYAVNCGCDWVFKEWVRT